MNYFDLLIVLVLLISFYGGYKNGLIKTIFRTAGYWNLLHQADLTLNGKPVETTQSFLNVYTHIRMLSQMSTDDLRTMGTTLGLG